MKPVIHLGWCGGQRRRILLILALGATGAGAQSPRGYGLIDGLVTDQSLAPLSDATVSILGSSVKVATGHSGRFQVVQLPAGRYVLMIRRLGYYPVSALVEVAAGDTARMSLTLEHVVALDTVVVSATKSPGPLDEFESRRRFGFGHFMTQADIERKKTNFVADLLRTILSVNIEEKGPHQFAVNTRSGCHFQLFLDGIPVPKAADDLNELPPPRDLAGIEIYSGPATIPVPYKRSGAECGVILFWSKPDSD